MSVDVVYEAIARHSGPWTEADFFALPPSNDRIELVDGALLVSPSPTVPHARLSLEVTIRLRQTCPDLGWEALPPADVRLWENHIRVPDIIVVRAGLQVRKVDVADVLVLVEITSPGNFRQDMIVKHGDYAEAGVPFYLRIDLHKGVDDLTASAYELVDGTYREYATAPDGVLRLTRPWPLEIDLRAAARGR